MDPKYLVEITPLNTQCRDVPEKWTSIDNFLLQKVVPIKNSQYQIPKHEKENTKY